MSPKPARSRSDEVEDAQIQRAMRTCRLITAAVMPGENLRAVLLISQRNRPSVPELAAFLRATADAFEAAATGEAAS
ncbi:MAG: hypothetical protein OXB99_01265 [Acidimicrobiaceae bacterium]|nr:hypothetical protein [Acidimicrobiaceae bacterium]